MRSLLVMGWFVVAVGGCIFPPPLAVAKDEVLFVGESLPGLLRVR
jgi:hypothetical protein